MSSGETDVTTEKLELAAKTPESRDIDGVIVFPPPAWHIEGVDFDVDARVDGNTGAMKTKARIHDDKGELASLEVSAPHTPVPRNGCL